MESKKGLKQNFDSKKMSATEDTEVLRGGQFRNICITWNNYSEGDYATIREYIERNCKYGIIGKEVGDSGTPHLQGYLEFKSPKRFETIKNHFPKIHFEKRRGTSTQAREYCTKDKDFWEHGSISTQGERTDLKKLTELISDTKSLNNAILDDPMVYHQYGRTLERVVDIKNRKIWRTWMTECDWYVGETGSGKSHIAFSNYSPDTHFVFNGQDNGFWDGYEGQPIVIINELRNGIPYSELLDLIDKYPKTVKVKGKSPIPFLAKKIIITSSLGPDQVYSGLHANDSIEQLYRRIRIFRLKIEDGKRVCTLTHDGPKLFEETSSEADLCATNVATEVVEGNTKASTEKTSVAFDLSWLDYTYAMKIAGDTMKH